MQKDIKAHHNQIAYKEKNTKSKRGKKDTLVWRNKDKNKRLLFRNNARQNTVKQDVKVLKQKGKVNLELYT